MSLKAKIEAVIYASEEPVTLLQLAGLLGEAAQAELEEEAAKQTQLLLGEAGEGDRAETPFADNADSMADAVVTPATDPPDGYTESLNALPEQATAGGDVTEPGLIGAEPGLIAAAEPAEEVARGDAEGATTQESEADKRQQRERERTVREHIRRAADTLIREYAENDRGIEIREVAGGYRMGTKPEYHDAVRGFVKSLKPALKLTLQALETLAVVAYKQPVTAAEISEIRGVDSAGVLGGLMTRKLIVTAGRKQVIGRPMLYKTTREFLMRFGLKDVHELPSMEEFEKMAGELNEQEDLPMEDAGEIVEQANVRGDAKHIREANDR